MSWEYFWTFNRRHYNPVRMGGWLKLVRLVWGLALHLGVRTDLADNCSGVCRVCQICPELCRPVQLKMQLKISNMQLQSGGFESRVWHTSMTLGKNSVGQHWWGTCLSGWAKPTVSNVGVGNMSNEKQNFEVRKKFTQRSFKNGSVNFWTYSGTSSRLAAGLAVASWWMLYAQTEMSWS